MDVKELLNIYKQNYPSRLDNKNIDLIEKYFETTYTSGKACDISKIINSPYNVEKNIAEHIIGSECSSIDVSYLSLYIQNNNASGIKDESSPTIIIDELLQYTLISFYFSIFSLVYNSNPNNFEKCFKNCVVLLDLQGNKHEIGTHNIDDLLDISHLPEKNNPSNYGCILDELDFYFFTRTISFNY